MSIMSASEARANLFGLIEQVNEDAVLFRVNCDTGPAQFVA